MNRAIVILVAAFWAATPIMAVAADRPTVMRPGEVLRGSFEQERHLEGFREPLRSSGSFAVSPDRGIIWRIEAPFPVMTVITPAGLVQQSEGVTLTQLPASRAQGLLGVTNILNSVLTGNLSTLDAEFDIRSSAERGGWKVEATPREKFLRSLIEGFTITGSEFADRVEVRKPGGDFDRIFFRGQSISSQFSEDELLSLSSVGK